MRYFSFPAIALALLIGACDDPEPQAPDGGVVVRPDATAADSGIIPDGGIVPDGGAPGRLDRPGLPRPPSGGLPDELRPPR